MASRQLNDALARMTLIRAYEENTAALQGEARTPGTCISVDQEASTRGAVRHERTLASA